MNKSIFAIMAFALVILLSGCKKESDGEIALSVSEITDSTAVVKCEFAPQKAVRYKLIAGSKTLIFYRSMSLTLSNLLAGENYSIVALAQDADKEEVEHKVVDFMTTGEPVNDGELGTNIDMEDIRSESPNNDVPKVSVTSIRDNAPTELEIDIKITDSTQDSDYQIEVKGPNYSQAQIVTPDDSGCATTIFSGLVSGNEYDIYYDNERLMGFVKE